MGKLFTRFNLALGFVMLLYLGVLVLNFLNFDVNFYFGYLDYQDHWQGVADLLSGKLIYRNFYWEYGVLMLLLRVPVHLLLGGTFLSTMVNDFIVLPFIGIVLSIVLGRQILNKKGLLVFLFLLLVYMTNNDFQSVRHLIPELGLLLVLMGVQANNEKKRVIGSVLLAVSLLSSIEYSLSAHAALGLYFIVLFLRRTDKRTVFTDFIRSFSLSVGVGLLFLSYLLVTQTLGSFIRFHWEYIQTFYYNSPCSDVFPRLGDFATLSQDTFSKNPFFNLLHFLSRINYYGVFAILLLLALFTWVNKTAKMRSVILALLFYSLLVYLRALYTPCHIYYGLTFIFLLVAYFLSGNHRQATKKLFWGMFVWLVLSSNIISYVLSLNVPRRHLPSAPQRFLPIAGIFLDRRLADEYQSITKYIKDNTDKDDSLYVYPHGPYNLLTGRISPVSVFTSWYYEIDPYLVRTTVDELKKAKPKYVIVNFYNALSMKTSLSGFSYGIFSLGENILIKGINTEVEEYIMDNYVIEHKGKIAWILRYRPQKKQYRIYSKAEGQKKWLLRGRGIRMSNAHVPDGIRFTVSQDEPIILASSPVLKDLDLLVIPIRVDLGLLRMFSKYTVEVSLVSGSGRKIPLQKLFLSGEKQRLYVELPFDKTKEGSYIQLQISKNDGFLPFGRPKAIELQGIEKYTVHPSMKITEQAVSNSY